MFQFKLRVEIQKPSRNTLNITYKGDQSFTSLLEELENQKLEELSFIIL